LMSLRSPILLCYSSLCLPYYFFLSPTAPTDILSLSLPDALPISEVVPPGEEDGPEGHPQEGGQPAPDDGDGRADDRCGAGHGGEDRKSTRLNSSHVSISYADFCLRKKKKRILEEKPKKK